MNTHAKIYVGTSGYSYNHWKDIFYPETVKSKEYLEYYSNLFNTVELNVTFYRTPPENFFKSWYARTPEHFLFALKANRYITHIKRLKVDQSSIDKFFSRAQILKNKCKVILWQLPPSLKVDHQRLCDFLSLLKPYNSYNHAFEIRNETWFCPETFNILDKFGATICRADWPEFAANIPHIGPFEYIRRHGTEGLSYTGGYSDEQLARDADLIKSCVKSGRNAYIYFNNDIGGWAPKNARTLIDILSK
jgi:uncharacterized protein YecE (DUF72 family)